MKTTASTARKVVGTSDDPSVARTLFRFFFHCRATGAVAVERDALFASVAVFGAQLADWSRDGWTYFVTDADAAANAKAVAVVCYGAIRGLHSEVAWHGTARHHHNIVITEVKAKEVAEIWGCRVSEAGCYEPTERRAIM
jgi:hypothetical protein